MACHFLPLISVRGNRLFAGSHCFVCAFGKGGFSNNKREGDGATPIGIFALRECLYRADKLQPPHTGLPLRIISQDDGWCDAPQNALYNRQIKRPFDASHEELWRADDVYDLIIPMGYNDAPVVPGMGSAIFMHVARPNYEPTEGCIALSLADWQQLLPLLGPDTQIEIVGAA
jgi:L,D-peptidoglycan transpeptidase YkuD (ErfK/YbiS/YcfS/YnhG family)